MLRVSDRQLKRQNVSPISNTVVAAVWASSSEAATRAAAFTPAP